MGEKDRFSPPAVGGSSLPGHGDGEEHLSLRRVYRYLGLPQQVLSALQMCIRDRINGAIYFDGTSWQRMDPTFASSGRQSAAIMQYIGDGKNYTAKYFY